jgi:hypothetical protein
MEGTNGKYFLTEDDIFMMQGREDGFSPSDEQLKAARDMARAMNMDIFKQRSAAMNPTNIQSAGALTNQATGTVYEVAKDGAGRIVQLLKPEVLQTTTGIQYISGPGRTRDFINEDTGQQPKGYAASGSFYAMGQPVVGGDNSAARDAAAAATGGAPSPTPSPSPRPPYSMTNAEGRQMTFENPYQVRQALTSGDLTLGEAKQALLHWGMK